MTAANTPDLRALVERLETLTRLLDHDEIHLTPGYPRVVAKACDEAAAALTTLQHRVAEMEAALEPFAREAARLDLQPEQDRYSFANTGLSYGDLRKARSTLKDRGEGR